MPFNKAANGSRSARAAKFRQRVASIHYNHKRIVSGAALIGALTILAKTFVAGREMAIAWRLGAGALVDAYQLGITIVTWLPVLITSVMTVILVPPLVALRAKRDEYDAFIAELNGTVVVAGGALTALIFFAAPVASSVLASHDRLAAVASTEQMAKSLAPVAFLIFVVGYLAARLQARQRFFYTVSEIAPAIIITAFVLLSPASELRAFLIAGTAAGFSVQLALMIGLIVAGDDSFGRMHLRHRSPAWKPVYRAAFFMGLGQLLIMATVPLDQGFAARLGEGSVATLGYASRILTLLSSLGSIVVGRALLPVLSAAIASGETDLARQQAQNWSCLLLLTGSAASAVFALAAPSLVRLLFERGAFTWQDAADVTHAFRYGLIQLPPQLAGIALVQWFAAANRFKALLVITAVALLSKLILNILLLPLLGLAGLMLATAIMYAFTAIAMTILTLVAPSPH